MDDENKSYNRMAIGISLVALVASVVSAWFTGCQYVGDQDFKKRMARPELAFSLSRGTTKTEYSLTNIGTGPAIVKGFDVSVDGEPQRSWQTVLDDLEISPHGPTVSYVLPDITAWPTDAHKAIFSIQAGKAADLLFAARDRIRMRACYCSALDACW